MSLIGPLFPRLTSQNHRETSPASNDYNCIAWAVGDTQKWWQPDVYWPIPAPKPAGDIQTLVQAYRSLGFEICSDGSLEQNLEKVALFGDSTWYLHAARQLATGKWTSKMGADVDIEHNLPDDVAGGVYGALMHFMGRPIAQNK